MQSVTTTKTNESALSAAYWRTTYRHTLLVLSAVSQNHMSTEFALDLRLARRKAGFTQRDCAHLLDVPVSVLAQLEGGKRLPSIVQICTLSLIYGRSFESLFGKILDDARTALRARIFAMPKIVRAYAGTRNREHSIEKLAQRLADETNENGGA